MNRPGNAYRARRSTFVTALAWVFIAFSGFATLIAILQNIMINTMFPVDQIQAAMQAAKEKQNIPPVAEFMMTHFRLFVGAFLVLSAITLVSSIALLKRKNWARLAVIGILGFGILWNVGGLFFQQSMLSSMSIPTTAAPPEFQSQFKAVATTMLVFAWIMAIGFSVLFGWIIKRLASAAIREEFRVEV